LVDLEVKEVAFLQDEMVIVVPLGRPITTFPARVRERERRA
jgi:hypothetical protein